MREQNLKIYVEKTLKNKIIYDMQTNQQQQQKDEFE